MKAKEEVYFLEGEKIYLRKLELDDVNENYYEWMNDEEIIKYTESRFFPISKDDLKKFVVDTESKQNAVFFAIIDKSTKEHIGNIKLADINWIHRFAEVGIIVGDKKYWGKGYASEAISILVDYAGLRLNLHKLMAGCYVNNIGSIKAFEKAGFIEEGVRRKHYYYDGQYIDAVLLGLIIEK